jgi:hypothetical protein
MRAVPSCEDHRPDGEGLLAVQRLGRRITLASTPGLARRSAHLAVDVVERHGVGGERG